MRTTMDNNENLPSESAGEDSSHRVDIGSNCHLEDTILFKPLRPLIALLKICGFYHHNAGKGHCTSYLIVYSIMTCFLNGFFVVNNGGIRILQMADSIKLEQVTFLITDSLFHIQNMMFYLQSSKYCALCTKFLMDFHTYRKHTERSRLTGIVYALVVLSMVFVISIILSVVLCVWYTRAEQYYSMIFPFPTTYPWILSFFSFSLVVCFHGVLAGTALLLQCLITCIILIKETQKWNKSFTQSIADDGAFSGNIEECRLEFEGLVDLVRQADEFMSRLVVTVTVTTVPMLCFLLYVVIQGSVALFELTGTIISLSYACFSLCVIFIAGTILSTTVSILMNPLTTC